MHLKRLEIFGFKSFAEKTTLNFEKGIAAIVGPNGCGKSNVFDSIRWVLGEQSVKELRGSSMEDVIFNGTDKKAPLGFAEVSLTFANETRILAMDADEIVITRRLFRSGESEYLINKNTSRLKDIVELFMGTGVGAEAYSLIQQGKVDLVVSAKPDDRRQIFDEAAGITKYKSKKKEALNKLKDAEENLLRINDIVVEVKRQIATIERQAKKAQRYKEDFELLKSYELVMAQHHMSQFDQETKAIEEGVRSLQQKEAEAQAQLQELNARIEHETGLIEEIEAELQELKSQQIRLDNDIELNTRQISFNEERLGSIDSTCQRLEIDQKAALERCAVSQVKIEEIKGALSQLEEVLNSAQSRLQEKHGALSALVQAITEAQEAIRSFETEIFALNAQEVRIKNQLTENMKRNMEALARKSRLEHEQNKVHSEKHQVLQKFEGINIAIEGVKNHLGQLWNALNEQRRGLDELNALFTSQEQTIDDLERAKVFLQSQKEFIQKMQVQYQESPDPIVEGKFISTTRPSENQTGIIGKIKQINTIAATETSSEYYEIIYETKYVELDLQHQESRIIDLDQQLTQALAIKEDLNVKIAEQDAIQEQMLKDIQDQEKKLSVLEAQRSDVELESGKIVGELDLISSEFAEIETTLATLKVQESELGHNLNQAIEAITRCKEDVRVKQAIISGKASERADLNVAIAQMEAEHAAIADKQKGLQDQMNMYTQGLDRDLADISRFESEFNELQAKKVKISEDIEALNDAIGRCRAYKETLNVQYEGRNNEKSEMVLRLSGIRNQTRGLEDQIIDAKNELHNFQMKEQELQFGIRTLKERLLQAYKIEWETFIQQPQATLPQATLSSSDDSSLSSSNDTLSSSNALIEDPQSEQPQQEQPQQEQPTPPQVNYEELALEIDRLKKRCDSYGAVNLVAIEEFDELKNRYEFLTKQQSDLLTAREQLMSTIQKINRTTRQMFNDTFTKVNEEFQVYFRMLFGGGEAQLILLDPENPLECGIDIVARPPGKKPQNISLLSGGEKTLTAIALIFGVFKVNPSPFCVLDEIDAALDESNVGRFATLLKEFAKIAQFVIITHNKKTMAVADVMYGVTQQERGISRIVSVKFNEFKPQQPTPESQPELATAN